MQLKKYIWFFVFFVGFLSGYMVGGSMDPVDRAIRKAQKINRQNLQNVDSLREGGFWNLFNLFSKPVALNTKILNDSKFSNQYVLRISNNIAKREEAIDILKDQKEFLRLARQENFIDQSLKQYLSTLGKIQLQHGMIFQATTNLQEAYNISPQDPSLGFLLGTAYTALYRLAPQDSAQKIQASDQAVQLLEQAHLSRPRHIQTQYTLALLYIDLGYYDKANILLQQILQQEPQSIDAHFALARIYYEEGDYEKARKAYEQTEGLILGLKAQKNFLRKNLNQSTYDQKLYLIQSNLQIIYQRQSEGTK